MTTTDDSPRLFIGVEPDRETQKYLDATVAHCRGLALPADTRWTSPSNRHLTLAFLGETRAELIDDIEILLQDIAHRHPPILAQAVCTTPFPKPRSRLLAMELLPNPALEALHRDCRQLMLQLGMQPESAHYRPHFTLARCRRGFSRFAPLPASHLCQLNNLVLYRSLLAPGGSQYEQLAHYPLQS